jgi:cobalt-zinc-cadmium efflux system membrane fusion protein
MCMKKEVLWTLLLALLAAGGGCGGSVEPRAAASAPEPSAASDLFVAKDAKGIKTMTVESSAIPEYLEIPGRITPDPTRVVHVYPTAGGRVIEMKVRPWDHVEKGEPLALLESSDASRAVADYEKARADSEVKKKALDRATDLYNHHAIAQRDVDQAQADDTMANEEMKATLDALHLLGVDPATGANQLRVLSPRAGVVLDIGASQGEMSKSLDAPQPLCTVADLSTVWVEGQVFEKDLAALKTGAVAEVTLNAYPGEKWTGRVSVVSGAVDPNTRTLDVRVILPNPGLRLKPDMFATVRLLRSSAQGILVPATAIAREGATAYVFVGKGGDKFERREVTLGRTVNDDVEITSGLSPGAVIVSEGVLLLRDSVQQ